MADNAALVMLLAWSLIALIELIYVAKREERKPKKQ